MIGGVEEDLPRPKRWSHRRMITEHAFDKLGAIDATLAEFEAAAEESEVIEETALEMGVAKQLVLVAAWLRPLHVVVIVDEVRQEDRILTIYEPYPEAWSSDYRRRR